MAKNSQIHIGLNQIAQSNLPKSLRPFARSNKDALKLSAAGARNLIQGTIKANRKKRKKQKK